MVDAYDLPSAESDLGAYRSKFGQPPCTTANGCFRKVDQNGGTSYPASNSDWAGEIALDIEMVSAACPNCHILLVEAGSNSLADLGAGVDTAVSLGAKYVSNSYGSPDNPYFAADYRGFDSYYNHPGVAVVASSGDDGYYDPARFDCDNGSDDCSGAQYPSTSDYVTAVGGTTLAPAAGTARGWSESAWARSGSGCSHAEPKPTWQTDTGCSTRTAADISAVADPNTGVAIYTSALGGWRVAGGTSASSPLLAASFALAGPPAAGSYPAQDVYQQSALLNDVTSGSSGSCGGSYLCAAKPHFDGPTGWGTPNGVAALTPTIRGALDVARFAVGSAIGSAVTTSDGTQWAVSGSEVLHAGRTGIVARYPVPSGTGGTVHLIGAANGNVIWFAYGDGRSADPLAGFGTLSTSNGAMTRFPRSGLAPWTSSLDRWSIGSDGALWYSARGERNLLHVSVTGTVSTYTLPTPPDGICEGGDGNVHWTSHPLGAGWITPTGAITTLLPLLMLGTSDTVGCGDSGSVWTTDGGSVAYRVSSSGALTPFTIPGNLAIGALTLGGNGQLWAQAHDASTTLTRLFRLSGNGTVTAAPNPQQLSASGVLPVEQFVGTRGGDSLLDVGYRNSSGAFTMALETVDRFGNVDGWDPHITPISSSDGNGSVWGADATDLILGRMVTTDRIAGPDRYSTAVAVARKANPTTASYAFVASGENYPDALAAGAVAAKLGAPLLLTASASLPSSVRIELSALKPTTVYVAGGSGAISDAVFSAIKAAVPGASVARVAGADRYATARALVSLGFPHGAQVGYFATGANFPDALSASAAAAAHGDPLILVNGSKSSLDTATSALIQKLGMAQAKIAGGTAVVSSGIQSFLTTRFGASHVQRFAGTDRYDTSVLISRDAFTSSSSAYLATGANFPDALAGAATAGRQGSPLITVRGSCISQEDGDELDRLGMSTAHLLGGVGALGQTVGVLRLC
ncbi:MAG TPA: cell wall-binding repeat-containing protein [Humibacter sp.]|nr:cell wall-binding repeat-containing protein [Humibacter sp.]